ncbi:hypothetical protein E4U34_001198 [Claviceps purpurea]|nr:hypothetical protein E4U28_000003 [Claviceps purpurea]KAG6222865.1 hypothetical protein E4U34_001198 [Claviceps purpurea]
MPALRQHQHQHQHPRRRRSASWLPTNNSGIYYRPESLADQQRPLPDHLPAPLIGPRRSRPHAIHIVTFPPGYIPRELRPDGRVRADKPQKARGRRPRTPTLESAAIPSSTFQPSRISSPTPSIGHSTRPSTNASTNTNTNTNTPNTHTTTTTTTNSRRSNHNKKGKATSTASHLLGKLISSFSGRSLSTVESLRPVAIPAPTRTTAAAPTRGVPQPPAYDDVLRESTARTQSQIQPHSSSPHEDLEADMAAVAGNAVIPSAIPSAVSSSACNVSGRRNSLMSVRSAKSLVNSLVAEVPRPVASGSGVSCSILLAESNIFLHGFDHDGHMARGDHGGTALLRGKLQLNVTKNVKIKAIQLKLMGRARTEWPEGIPPLRQEVSQVEGLRTQVLTFFNVMHDGWESEYGNQCTYKLRTGSANSSSTNLHVLPQQNRRPVSMLPPSASYKNGLTAKQLKRLSLQSTQSRSFGKSESGATSTTQAKGYKVFYPGTYDYNFELPIDHHQLETIKLQYGSVKWELHASIDRAGAFKPKLQGLKEVSVVRLPDQMSLEMSEPISISRLWEDQLHYDIVISGKSFPIGSKIPIAFKLTPLAKVQLHKMKVYVTESIEYWTTDKRVTRKDPVRKILLLEKSAGKPLESNCAASEMNTLSGGELSPEGRRQAREMAILRRTREAALHGLPAEPLPEPTSNLLGDLDLGLEHMWGATEIEANVQLPTCQMMAKNKDLRLHADCSWKNVNVYHWIKIVLRISRLDPEDPTGTKRRHFEISIDSPFTVLNCRATQANTDLPAYASPISQPAAFQSTCGCPDAAMFASDGSPNSSSGTLPGLELRSHESSAAPSPLPNLPQAAYLSRSSMNPATDSGSLWRSGVDDGSHGEPRPIHLLRVPSFQPPAFDDDTAPPPAPVSVAAANSGAADVPLMTPPPQYDAVVGTPSVDGLADYFARLADYGYLNEDETESGSDSDEPPRILGRSGRVNVCNPRTPGSRRMPSRSFEISRPTVDLNLASLPHHLVQRPARIQ